MTHESFHIVDASKGAGVVEKLLEVVAHTEVATYGNESLARLCALSIVGVRQIFATARDEVERIVGDKLKAFAQEHISSHVCVEGVGIFAIIVEGIVREGI